MSQIIKSKPAHEQIAEILREEIAEQYKTGDALPSARALCTKFEVSPTTVNTALDNLERDGVVERRHGSGTFVSEPLDKKTIATENQRHIAILIDKDISHPKLPYSHRRMSETLLRFFEERNLPAKRYTGRKEPWEFDGEPSCPEFLDSVKANSISAVILLATHSHSSWSDLLQKRSVPIIGEWGSDTEVMPDYSNMQRQAVDYLHDLGRDNIALMEWYDPQTVSGKGEDISHAFKDRMQELGLPIQEKWIRRDLPAAALGAGWEGFREIWLASEEKPDGLIIMDDILFRDAVTAICQIGIDVPQELMIVTHANKGSEIFSPLPAAKMESDVDKIAHNLGKMTINLLNNKSIKTIKTRVPHKWIEPELIKSNRKHKKVMCAV